MSKRLGLVSAVLGFSIVGCPPGGGPLPPAISDPANTFAVAAYGDSLTSGWGGVAGWPTELASDTVWTVFNGGIAGELAIDGADRPLGANHLPVLVDGYDVVVVWWGTNDTYSNRFFDDLTPAGYWVDYLTAYPGVAIEPAEVIAAIEGVVSGLRDDALAVVLVWPPPMIDENNENHVRGTIRLERLIDEMQDVATTHGAGFVDLFTEFDALSTPEDYYQADGVHLNAAGAALASELIEAEIRAHVPGAP